VWGLDAQGIAWQGEGGPQCVPHGEGAAALALARPGVPIDIVVGSDLAVHWVQQPPAATRSLPELQLVAAARCAHLHGGAPGHWWVAADWNTRRPFVCAALPRGVAQPLQDACAARGIAARWHTAWGVVASAAAAEFPDDGWSALRTPQRVLLWHCSGGRVDALTGFGVAADADAAKVEALLAVSMQLEAAGSGFDAQGAVRWSGAGPQGAGFAREALASLALGSLMGGAPA
jgi:hypothetical protein